MKDIQKTQPEKNKEKIQATKKEKWNPPVIVPLDVTLSEHFPRVGSDGGHVSPDSTYP
ncbi:MAG: hypothetical protein HQM08_13850 [Candidatus Riflebacteria bacterium]|nr:hypothetical protein [Candidatus Riflebacteria bacterium]